MNTQHAWLVDVLKRIDPNDTMLISLYDFFVTKNNIQHVLPIITTNSEISIRILDWFVTNYAKKNNTIYPIVDAAAHSVAHFNVYLQYKAQLKGYKKKLFDPFCRKQRIFFYYDRNKCFVTTIGQLNFFRWALKYNVLDYVSSHLQEITEDMNTFNRYTKSDDSSSERRKRHELSSSANKSIVKHNFSTVVAFD